MNGQGALVIQVTKPAEATLLAKIIHLVQEAQSERPPSQLFVERFERTYAKIVVAGAIFMAALPPIFLGWTWNQTIYRAMIFLVVASPCALVSSIMPAVLSGIANGARNGILFKGGAYLETIGSLDVVAFDKTGTLTEGVPKVTDITAYGKYTETELLSIAASLETWSEHPIAKAITSLAKERNIELLPTTKLEAIPGLGVHGSVDGRECIIGKVDLIEGLTLSVKEKSTFTDLEQQGKTVIFVKVENEVIGLLAVQDTLRAQARKSVDTDIALETANVVLMADDLSKVSYAISLGRRSTRVIKQNVTFAIGVILVLVISNFVGYVNLPLGVIGHEGSTITVIISGLRMLSQSRVELID
ncbi:HAD-IC family P-type ATPase [Desulfosporosinus sp. SYSU MS00001]|uniref:HAD-IC family P-type ATPase n=1 Tax=Desulfosporosinus sp. SYSU MS00001 TaxID=3416284 RepID=UPI003CE7AC71